MLQYMPEKSTFLTHCRADVADPPAHQSAGGLLCVPAIVPKMYQHTRCHRQSECSLLSSSRHHQVALAMARCPEALSAVGQSTSQPPGQEQSEPEFHCNGPTRAMGPPRFNSRFTASVKTRIKAFGAHASNSPVVVSNIGEIRPRVQHQFTRGFGHTWLGSLGRSRQGWSRPKAEG